VGQLAENLVAEWLQQQGWQILAQRWHCRQGELDLVAVRSDCLAFIEVKARSRGNWDADGLLAITPAKQEKLTFTAQMFLAAHPALAELPCRFDVAIVKAQSKAQPAVSQPVIQPATQPVSQPITIGQPLTIENYRLTLQHYISGAFESSIS
jgi:putative endonuclease